MVSFCIMEDPRSYAEFECMLDAADYAEVARESSPKWNRIIMVSHGGCEGHTHKEVERGISGEVGRVH